MHNQRWGAFKQICGIGGFLLAMISGTQSVANESPFDLLSGGGRIWLPADKGWVFDHGEISGTSGVMDGAIADPAASTFLVSREKFGGDITVTMDVTFETGLYLGIYLDFDQATQTGIWMATGDALTVDAATNDVERAYIKTVEDSFWAVRASGDLIITPRLRLRFVRKGDAYSIWNDGRLIATYHKAGGYPAGPLQLRLTHASARIHRLDIVYDRNVPL